MDRKCFSFSASDNWLCAHGSFVVQRFLFGYAMRLYHFTNSIHLYGAITNYFFVFFPARLRYSMQWQRQCRWSRRLYMGLGCNQENKQKQSLNFFFFIYTRNIKTNKLYIPWTRFEWDPNRKCESRAPTTYRKYTRTVCVEYEYICVYAQSEYTQTSSASVRYCGKNIEKTKRL